MRNKAINIIRLMEIEGLINWFDPTPKPREIKNKKGEVIGFINIIQIDYGN